jgi:hypothetical protein
MYLHNKYTTWYNSIISAAQSRILPETTYTETHHIIPKSLGGSNTKSNLVRLTAREHFVCHWLLTKMTNSNKMHFAFRMMFNSNSQHQRYVGTSRTYDHIRNQLSIIRKGMPAWNKGKTGHLTEEQRAKISAGNRAKGPQSAETIAKRVAKTTGKVRTTEQRKRSSDAQKGRVLTEDHKAKLAAAAKIRISTPRPTLKGKPSATAKTWLLTFPDGTTETVYSLRMWCKDHNISYGSMHSNIKAGKPYKGLKVKPI